MKEYLVELFSLQEGRIALHTCTASSRKAAKADARKTYPDFCVMSVVEIEDIQLQAYHLQESYV